MNIGDVITTVEQLDTLPRGATVVIDDAEGSLVAVKDGRCWHAVGMDPLPSADLWDLSIDPEEGGPTPVVLVHLPGRAPRPERVVKAEALREAAEALMSIESDRRELRAIANRHARAWGVGVRARWLWRRADRIEAGEE